MISPEKEGSRKTLRLLWAAFTYSTFMYGLIGYLVRRSGVTATSGELLSMLTPTFLSLASLETGALFLFMPQFAGKTTYFSYSIIRWVLAESIGIYGFVLFVFGVSPTIFGIFLGWALLLDLTMMPNKNDRNKFELLKDRCI